MLFCGLAIQLRWDGFDLWSHYGISNDTIKLLSFSCCIYPYKVEQFPHVKGSISSTHLVGWSWLDARCPPKLLYHSSLLDRGDKIKRQAR